MRANNDEDIVGQVQFVSKTRAELMSNYDSLNLQVICLSCQGTVSI
jgi:hypothetical protein